tara:strand:- start:38576 stop:38848 length:273 start_codon:yes stop_codon:yes gene_type:complete
MNGHTHYIRVDIKQLGSFMIIKKLNGSWSDHDITHNYSNESGYDMARYAAKFNTLEDVRRTIRQIRPTYERMGGYKFEIITIPPFTRIVL